MHLCSYPEEYTSPDEYRTNLQELKKRLLAYTPHVASVTTTPVGYNVPINDLVVKYNEVSLMLSLWTLGINKFPPLLSTVQYMTPALRDMQQRMEMGRPLTIRNQPSTCTIPWFCRNGRLIVVIPKGGKYLQWYMFDVTGVECHCKTFCLLLFCRLLSPWCTANHPHLTLSISTQLWSKCAVSHPTSAP